MRQKKWIPKVALAAMMIGCMAMASLGQPGHSPMKVVSFWLPGQMGSFAAVPGEPGWSLPVTYQSLLGDASGSKTFQIGAQVTAGFKVQTDLFMLSPTYLFRDPVAGGQTSVGLTGLFGRQSVDADATLAGPGGTTLSGEKKLGHVIRV